MIKGFFAGAAALVMMLLSNGSALANACKTVRPAWSGETVGLIGEAFNLVFSSGGIVLIIMMILAFRFRHLWFSIIIASCAFLLAFMNFYAWRNPVGIDVDARQEGCIGEPTLAIAVFIFLGILILLAQFFGSPLMKKSEG